MLISRAIIHTKPFLRYITTIKKKPWQKVLNELLSKEVNNKNDLKPFEELVKNDPSNVNLLARYSGLLFHHKLYSDMPPVLDRIDELDPGTSLSFYLKALIAYEENPEKNSRKMFNEFFNLDFETSAEKGPERDNLLNGSEEAEEEDYVPEQPLERLYRAMLVRRTGNSQLALNLLEIFLDSYGTKKERRNDLEVILEQVQIYFDLGQYKDALELLEGFLADDAYLNDFKPNFYKGIALRRLGKFNLAVSELKKLMKLPLSSKRKAFILLETARSRHAEDLRGKLADLEEAKGLDPSFEIVRETIISYFMAGQMRKAELLLDEYEVDCNIRNDYPLLVIKGSVLRHSKKDLARAALVYNRLKYLAPDDLKNYFGEQAKSLNNEILEATAEVYAIDNTNS